MLHLLGGKVIHKPPAASEQGFHSLPAPLMNNFGDGISGGLRPPNGPSSIINPPAVADRRYSSGILGRAFPSDVAGSYKPDMNRLLAKYAISLCAAILLPSLGWGGQLTLEQVKAATTELEKLTEDEMRTTGSPASPSPSFLKIKSFSQEGLASAKWGRRILLMPIQCFNWHRSRSRSARRSSQRWWAKAFSPGTRA